MTFPYNDQPLAPQGWQCPACRRVYSPTMVVCMYCGNPAVKQTPDTAPIVEWPARVVGSLRQGWERNMTDRELLEAAAKAAGYRWKWFGEHFHVQTDEENRLWHKWNPLTDDGDALRLAVRVLPFHILQYSQEDYLACNQDGLAATRRAIVRAAAEIGAARPGDSNV